MHGDEAVKYGFRGGLVPGVDVLAYLAHEAVERWGEQWLGGGRLNGRLISPCYDGEELAVETDEKDGRLSSRVLGSKGDERAVATMSLVTDPETEREMPNWGPDDIPASTAPDPANRPPAAAELLAPGTVLATQHSGFHAEYAPMYLDQISEDHPAFRESRLAHPGWIMVFANFTIASTVQLGPWIHVASDAWFLRAVGDGERIEVRADVSDRFEKKGHEMVDMRVLYLVGDEVAARINHRAIWQPRRNEDRDREHPADAPAR